MNFFLKLVGLPRKGSGSFGIDTKTIPKKFGAPSMSRTGDIPDDTVSSKFRAGGAMNPRYLELSDTVFDTVI